MITVIAARNSIIILKTPPGPESAAEAAPRPAKTTPSGKVGPASSGGFPVARFASPPESAVAADPVAQFPSR